MRCKARDLYPLPSSRQVTREGFLVAPAKINRTGVQTYFARELGLDGGDKPVRLYRPAEEVFRKETLDSFEDQTTTDDHPVDDVNSENWSKLAKGDVRDVCADGEFTAARVIVKDETAKQKVKDGKAELSCGYSFDLDMTPGTTARGEKYDGVQRNIIGNHVAIVDRGRAGFGVRIADRQPERETPMPKMHHIALKPLKVTDKLTVPGFAIDVELEDAVAATVRDAYDRHANALSELKDAHAGVCDERDFHKDRADGMASQLKDMSKNKDDEDDGDEPDDDDEELGENKKKAPKAKDAAIIAKVAAKLAAQDVEIKRLIALTAPEMIEKAAEARAKVVGDAKTILGKDFDPKGKTIAQIRIAALDAALKDEKVKDVATAVLGGTEPAKADEAKQTMAFDAVKAARGKVTAADEDTQDSKLSRILLGDGEGAAPVANPAKSYWQREAAMSRKPANGKYVSANAGDAAVED